MNNKLLVQSSRIIDIFYLIFLLTIVCFEMVVEKGNISSWIIHLFPVVIAGLPFAVSFYFQKIGGWLHLITGLTYCIFSFGTFPWSTYFLIAGPIVAAGVLLLIPSKN